MWLGRSAAVGRRRRSVELVRSPAGSPRSAAVLASPARPGALVMANWSPIAVLPSTEHSKKLEEGKSDESEPGSPANVA